MLCLKEMQFYLDFELEEGMEVVITGRASIYPATGSFQLYCDEIKKEGQGELFIKFEKLKGKTCQSKDILMKNIKRTSKISKKNRSCNCRNRSSHKGYYKCIN